jgi:hypothetical protein
VVFLELHPNTYKHGIAGCYLCLQTVLCQEHGSAQNYNRGTCGAGSENNDQVSSNYSGEAAVLYQTVQLMETLDVGREPSSILLRDFDLVG